MRTVCNRGGGGSKKSGKNAYVIIGRPLRYFDYMYITMFNYVIKKQGLWFLYSKACYQYSISSYHLVR